MAQRSKSASLAIVSAALVSCGGPYTATSTSASDTSTGTSDTSAGTDGGTSTTSGASSSAASTSAGTSASAETTDATDDATSTSSTTAGDTECEFVCATDMPPAVLECDEWTQDCPEGQKCAAFGDGVWDSTHCVPVIGDGQPGDPCVAPKGPTAGEDTCAKGVMCWAVSEETNEGVCVALCAGNPRSPECALPNTHCYIWSNGVASLCLPYCDPVLQDCQEGVCVPDDGYGQFSCAADESGGVHPAGAPCEAHSECNAGNACSSVALYPHPDCEDALGCCAPYCDLNDPQCPSEPPGLACAPWYEEGQAPPGSEHVGVCSVPP